MSQIAVPPSRSWAVGVVIPARDEEDTIDACVDCALASLDACAEVEAGWVVVVADSCHDLTASLARKKLAGRGAVIECSLTSPGAARRCGVAEVLAHFATRARSDLWLANTDADSCVAPDWISRQLELAAREFCGVAGIVRVDPTEGPDAALIREVLTDYATHEDGTHPHVHGANLGVRADAYLDVGGWSDLTVAEDHCLWSRLRAREWPLISSVSSVVFTSGRLHGRAVGGFADALRRKIELLRA